MTVGFHRAFDRALMMVPVGEYAPIHLLGARRHVEGRVLVEEVNRLHGDLD